MCTGTYMCTRTRSLCLFEEGLILTSSCENSLSFSLTMGNSKTTLPTLVLDLDETLVHASPRPGPSSSFKIYVEQDTGSPSIPFYISERPHLNSFIKTVSQMYRIVIFTASRSRYADKVIDQIDPYGAVSMRLYRQDCTRSGSTRFAKNLSRFDKDLRRVILLDNSEDSFALQPNNGILIKAWYGGNRNDDTELLDVIPFLEILSSCKDVRSILSRRRRKKKN